jgi:hypothetical protein
LPVSYLLGDLQSTLRFILRTFDPPAAEFGERCRQFFPGVGAVGEELAQPMTGSGAS